MRSDIQDGNGAGAGYVVTPLESGDKVFLDTTVMVQTAPGDVGKPATQVTQTYFIRGGTGKFKDLRGVLRSSSVTDFSTATKGAVVNGEYYFVQ